MAVRPATIAAPASATQVVNSEEPVIVFATESALRRSGLPGAYTAFRPRPATRCHETKASLVLVSQRRSVRGDYHRDRGGTVRKVFVTLNPDKLAHLRAPQGVSK